jgi:hypothetical protein
VRPIYRTGVPLPSRCCILCIFSTTINTEYFKRATHSPFFSSKYRLFHNATFFGSCIILCVLRAKYPPNFPLFCLCHPNNVLWKGQRSGLRRHDAVCAWCLCPCLTAPDFIFWTTSLMFGEFCMEIMPLEASPTADFPHPVVTTRRTLERGGRYGTSSARFRIVNVCGYRCSKDIHLFLRYL